MHMVYEYLLYFVDDKEKHLSMFSTNAVCKKVILNC